ncbi:MAG TPA: hypothetical protein VFQ85_00525 [Mycobacteriales bacterium]|nr:hypothetical protein [Mycobacteriales bacterium]
MRRPLAFLCLLVATAFAPHAASAQEDPDCGGSAVFCGADSDGTSYDAVIGLPELRSKAGGGGHATSSCTGCEYALVPACSINSPTNGADALCGAAVNSCRGEGILFWVYVRRPGESWDQIGTSCIGADNPPLTVGRVTADAREYLRRMTPPAAAIGVQPPAGKVLVNKAAYFAATGAAPMTETFGPAGARLTLTATPSYVWDFGDGSAAFETASAGGPYPTGDVTHVYRDAARPTVTLTTRWSATFTVVTNLGTFGPFPVGGPPVAPSSTRVLTVREGRAELVAR